MEIKENFSLKHYNTFGLDHRARYFTQVNSVDDLREALNWATQHGLKTWVLGEGSNVLLTKDIEGLTIHMGIKGCEIKHQTDTEAFLRVGAGEVWHEFVNYSIEFGLGGIENLSLIPGTVGAAPIQNIGAYGVELKDVFESLEALEISSGNLRIFSLEECEFGYRDSFFKQAGKGKYIICYVTFRLSKDPIFNLTYGSVEETMHELGFVEPDLRAVSETISFIRRQKLPDPAKIGNAGSFFKNPTISEDHFNRLKATYPSLPGFKTDNGTKVPAAWLIEQAGWKGKRSGSVGVHERQPLVLVNYGDGKGSDILHLSSLVTQAVREKFGIQLEPEVNQW